MRNERLRRLLCPRGKALKIIRYNEHRICYDKRMRLQEFEDNLKEQFPINTDCDIIFRFEGIKWNEYTIIPKHRKPLIKRKIW